MKPLLTIATRIFIVTTIVLLALIITSTILKAMKQQQYHTLAKKIFASLSTSRPSHNNRCHHCQGSNNSFGNTTIIKEVDTSKVIAIKQPKIIIYNTRHCPNMSLRRRLQIIILKAIAPPIERFVT